METKRQSKHATGRCSKHDSGERCHEEAHMHEDPSGMLARIPFGLTTGPIEGAEFLLSPQPWESNASANHIGAYFFNLRQQRHLTMGEVAGQ